MLLDEVEKGLKAGHLEHDIDDIDLYDDLSDLAPTCTYSLTLVIINTFNYP
jgi:hypothetical protein